MSNMKMLLLIIETFFYLHFIRNIRSSTSLKSMKDNNEQGKKKNPFKLYYPFKHLYLALGNLKWRILILNSQLLYDLLILLNLLIYHFRFSPHLKLLFIQYNKISTITLIYFHYPHNKRIQNLLFGSLIYSQNIM